MRRRNWLGIGAAALLGCGPVLGEPKTGSDSLGSTSGTATGGGTGDAEDSGVCGQAGDGSFRLSCDVGPIDPQPEGPPKVDLLLVVDELPSMRTEAPWLGTNLLRLVSGIERLTDPGSGTTDIDLQMMVVSSQAGHPLCGPAPFAPSTRSCLDRPDDFDDPEVCSRSCNLDFELPRPFVRLAPDASNLDAPILPADIDGDGDLDGEAGQLLACVGPLGNRGCEYGSPLEAMLRALDPGAGWNVGPEPFLRPDSSLAIVLVSDAPDCSVADPTLATSSVYMNVDPQTGQPTPTPAMCHNAGAQCELIDGPAGEYACTPSPSPLQPLDRYRDYLTSLIDDGRSVSLSVVGGFPSVAEHNDQYPFDPVQGGLFDTVYRNWRDPAAPEGDILPMDWDLGVDAEAQQFYFGIGPGCTDVTDDGQGRQSTAPLRQVDLCLTLDDYDDRLRCCHESLCDDDWSLVGVCAVMTAAGDALLDGGLIPNG